MFDPLSPNFTRNPYATYARLRQQDEPYFYAGMNVYLLSRYADVDAVARDAHMVRSPESVLSPELILQQQRQANWHDMPNHERFVQFSMLEQDGESHRRLRMIVFQEFSRTYVARHSAMIQSYVDGLLDEVLARKEIDFVNDLAVHVPGHVIGNLLGVPDEDCAQLRVWTESIVQYFDADRSDVRKKLAEDATTGFHHYLQDLIAERERRPQEDLLSTLVQAKQAGRMSETELVSTSMLILAAGHGSTIDVLGTGMYALLKHPDQLNMLQQQPQHIHTAVQEMFRYESPLPFFHRYASVDVEVMGRTYQQGTKFGLLYGSANRDPQQFSHADQFDITRTPNRHMAFGRGAHLCLGNHLSRLDMEIIFRSLLKRVKAIELCEDEPRYKTGLSARGLQALPIRLQPA
jgi:cytochrome P450